MTTSKGSAGVHRVKRNVDSRWLKRQLKDHGLTLEKFAIALAKETKRDEPLDKASICRRLKGQIPFPAIEAEALARMFKQPIETVLAKIGGTTGEPPIVGTVSASGDADVKVDAGRSVGLQRLVLDTRDGWCGAIVFAAVKPTSADKARRGLYLVGLQDGETKLVQVIGATGGMLLTASMFGESTVSLAFGEIKNLCRITKIEFPE